MRILIQIFLIVILVSSQVFAVQIEVLKVYDGDTILAKIQDNTFRIRLIDIDCFEGTKGKRAQYQARRYKMSQDEIVAGGNMARDILSVYLKNKKANFEFMGIDKYNRALGVLYTDGENINEKMLESPYCKPYQYFK